MTVRSRVALFDERAESITHNRLDDYGNPLVSFNRIALLWSSLLGTKVTPQQVAHMMILLKLSRLQHTPDHLDSLVDVVGYARCAVMCGPEFEERPDGQPF